MHKATVRQHADNLGNQTDHMRPSLSSYDNVDVFHLAQTTQTSAVFWNFANFREDCIETLKNNKEEQHWLIQFANVTITSHKEEKASPILENTDPITTEPLRRLCRNFYKNVGKYGVKKTQ
ncbi:conserved hypothetical protein [Trichinella spiralis]|uniref:hypothetical protein n=1 Tax=Trichinella spiralis TaxID=6334 RepID=UPI0001EFDBBB|nr:conserved hypothetical protein [Trichinella spiralis]